MDILLPSLSAGMVDGLVARWLKSEGDDIVKGEPIAEIETDKATMELVAEASGRLGAIHIGARSHANVAQIIGTLIVANEAQVPQTATRSSGAQSTGPRIFASPLARRLARTGRIDLAALSGSGPRGRIVRNDVQRAMSERSRSLRDNAPASAPERQPDIAGLGVHDRIPHSSIRSTTARRLLQSKTSIPHFYLEADIAASALLALRAEINAIGPEETVSINDLIIKACAHALTKVPQANALWTNDAVLRFHEADIAVAVATDGGLYTPVLRNAGRKSILEIARETKDFIRRARENSLQPAEYQGGVMTISNLGMYGVKSFSAIINPPHSCILAVGTCEKRPIVRDNAIAIDDVISCTLSVDHRVLDGAIAAELLAAIRLGIEQPMRLLV